MVSFTILCHTCCAHNKLTLNNSGPICDNVIRKLWIDSSTFLSTSYSNPVGLVPTAAVVADVVVVVFVMDVVAAVGVLAILGYVKSNPSHSTSRGDTGPGERILLS